jgi:hypothetical protein
VRRGSGKAAEYAVQVEVFRFERSRHGPSHICRDGDDFANACLRLDNAETVPLRTRAGHKNELAAVMFLNARISRIAHPWLGIVDAPTAGRCTKGENTMGNQNDRQGGGNRQDSGSQRQAGGSNREEGGSQRQAGGSNREEGGSQRQAGGSNRQESGGNRQESGNRGGSNR